MVGDADLEAVLDPAREPAFAGGGDRLTLGARALAGETIAEAESARVGEFDVSGETTVAGLRAGSGEVRRTGTMRSQVKVLAGSSSFVSGTFSGKSGCGTDRLSSS